MKMPLNRAFSYQRRNASCQSLLLHSLLLVSAAVASQPAEVSTLQQGEQEPVDASPVAVADHLEQLDEFVVIGRFPGPPLWKVSRNGNVLWILPLIDAYPKKMEWDSARVEALIAQSQEYIERPLAYRGLSTAKPMTMIRISRFSKRSRTLPDGQELQDVLSPELYQRFQSLKDKYLSRDREIETLRVSAAGSRLQQEILAQENLETLRYNRGVSPEVITSRLSKWMKRNKAMRHTSTSYGSMHEISSRDLKLAEEAMEEASTISAFASWEVACLEKTIAYFEKDIGLVKKRANAWARGHADDLLDPTPLNGQGDACNDPPAIPEDSPAMAKLREEAPGLAALLLNDRSEAERTSGDRWIAAAEVALANNATTFSAL
jgi:hypothetical protein